MVGEVVCIGIDTYVKVNQKGTLEKLPPMKWHVQLWVLIRQRFKPYTYKEIRAICYQRDPKEYHDTEKIYY